MKEVAAILYVTPRTVAYHKYRMMEVLGVTSSSELVKYAVRTHMVAA
jgi:DNA-binding CsgD family transcriptional regulator